MKGSSLLKSGVLISFWTFISRILGLVRDIILATTFGGSGLIDAFLVAFKIPNFFRRLFAEGAFTQSFLPMVIEFQSKHEELKLREFLSHTMGFLIIVISLFCALGVIFSDIFVLLFAGGLSLFPQRFDLASSMLKITFPYLGLITLCAYCMALQNSRNRFGLPAFTPVVLNVTMILSVIYLAPMLTNPIKAAAWAVLIAGIIQFSIQLPAVYKEGLLPMPKIKLRIHPSTSRLLILMLPILIGGSMVQINLLIDTLLASFLVEGSISWLYFAERLIQLPLGVFGVAITTIMMPRLTRLHHTSGARSTRHFLAWGIRITLIICMPATVGLIIMTKPILLSIYYYGSFSAEDINNTSLALMAYSIGLPAFIFIKVFSSVFFAFQDTKTPLKASLLATAIGIGLSLILVWFLRHTGLALSTSIAAAINALFLAYKLKQQQMFVFNSATYRFFSQLLIALIIMGLFLIYIPPWLQIYDGFELTAYKRAVNLAFIIIPAACLYFIALYILGVRWRNINMA